MGRGGFKLWAELAFETYSQPRGKSWSLGFGAVRYGSEARVLSFLSVFRSVGDIAALLPALKNNLFCRVRCVLPRSVGDYFSPTTGQNLPGDKKRIDHAPNRRAPHSVRSEQLEGALEQFAETPAQPIFGHFQFF